MVRKHMIGCLRVYARMFESVYERAGVRAYERVNERAK